MVYTLSIPICYLSIVYFTWVGVRSMLDPRCAFFGFSFETKIPRPEPLHTSSEFGMFDDNVWLCLAAFMAGFVGAALFDPQLSISSAKLKCQQPQWTQWCEPLPTRPIRRDLRDHGYLQRKQLSEEQLALECWEGALRWGKGWPLCCGKMRDIGKIILKIIFIWLGCVRD